MSIKPEKAVIDEAVLDLIGKEFKFDHAKGIAEWFKNSTDAYNLDEIVENEQIIILILDLSHKDIIKSIGVIDFVGMTKNKIDAGFKRWFDPNAAKTDLNLDRKQIKTFGGHGNGGKFYMREMFRTSEMITYRNSKLNIFGFNERKQYGFDPNYINKPVELDEALEIASLNNMSNVITSIEQNRKKIRAFSVVRGYAPKRAFGTNNLSKLIDKLIIHPQARRLIQRRPIYICLGNNGKLQRLQVPLLSPKKGFDKAFTFTCPVELEIDSNQVRMVNHKYKEQIVMNIFTSSEPLKGIKYRGLNSIDFLGEYGVIANYDISELGHFRTYSFSEFLYGEVLSPIMEDTEYDCVMNDRQKFIDTPKSRVLLNWTRDCIENVCNMMESTEKKEKGKIDLLHTSEFNKLLDKWKNKFMHRLLKEQLSGIGERGISGFDKIEWSANNYAKPHDTNPDKRKKLGDSGGSESKKTNVFPTVLISGIDPDPISEDGTTFQCDERHSAVYQRPIDFKLGIYWINTSKPLAQKIIQREGANSKIWRDYLFQRYVDIITKESIYNLAKTNTNLTADEVTNEIDNIVSKVHDTAAIDLIDFLFENDYSI
jgi:hypothetical protein